MKVGLDDYKFGRKNNWRRWKWNQIVNKLKDIGKNPRDAIILYLCGPSDIDREIAISKGISNENLIAVDFNESNISTIRKNNKLGIYGDLNSILRNWTPTYLVDVIDADFCCGLNKATIVFGWLLNFTMALAPYSVISINLLRGRDKEFSKLREAYIGDNDFCPYGKDRAKHLYNMIVNWYIDIRLNWQEINQKPIMTDEEVKKLSYRNQYKTKSIIDFAYYGFRPKFNTYKSLNKNVVMDSVIFTFERIFAPRGKGIFQPDQSMKMQIAAIKAWRTMRLKGASIAR